MSRRERRQAPRIQPFIARCQFDAAAGRRALGYVVELSDQGARVASPAPPPAIGAKTTIEIRFQRPRRQLLLKGVVRWQQARQDCKDFIFGLAFARLKSNDRRLLASVIAEFAERAAKLA